MKLRNSDFRLLKSQILNIFKRNLKRKIKLFLIWKEKFLKTRTKSENCKVISQDFQMNSLSHRQRLSDLMLRIQLFCKETKSSIRTLTKCTDSWKTWSLTCMESRVSGFPSTTTRLRKSSILSHFEKQLLLNISLSMTHCIRSMLSKIKP